MKSKDRNAQTGLPPNTTPELLKDSSGMNLKILNYLAQKDISAQKVLITRNHVIPSMENIKMKKEKELAKSVQLVLLPYILELDVNHVKNLDLVSVAMKMDPLEHALMNAIAKTLCAKPQRHSNELNFLSIIM
jgi:hypothetical protein